MRVDWCVSSWFRIKNTHTLTPPQGRGLIARSRYRASGPLGALLSSPPALDVRLMIALQVLQVRPA